jgi:hypothetical protein
MISTIFTIGRNRIMSRKSGATRCGIGIGRKVPSRALGSSDAVRKSWSHISTDTRSGSMWNPRSRYPAKAASGSM